MALLLSACRLVAAAHPQPRQQLTRLVQFYSTPSHKGTDVEAILAKPTWSVRSLLRVERAESTSPSVTPQQLRHLLRLSALPQPCSEEEEREMLATLESQINFVRQVQSIDATGVEPLQCIRDESPDAMKEKTIGLNHLEEAMSKERVFGRRKRIQRTETAGIYQPDGGIWDGNALSQAPKSKGKYFVVEAND